MTRDNGSAAPKRAEFASFAALADQLAETAPTRAELAARQKRDERPDRAQRLIRSGIQGAVTPEDFDWIVNDALPLPTHALRAIKRWEAKRNAGTLKRPVTTLAMVGDKGRGKTVACAWLLAGIGGAYITAEDLRKLFVSGLPELQQQYARVLSERVLLVDDLGTERDAKEARAMLYDVTLKRTGLRHGWTMYTANLLEPEFMARYDSRTTDKIRHMGEIVIVEGENLRRGGA